MTQHKHAGLLRAIADGKEIQFRSIGCEWETEYNISIILSAIASNVLNSDWRIKPETIKISDGEVALEDKAWWKEYDGPKYVTISKNGHGYHWDNAIEYPHLYSIKEPEFEMVKVYKYMKEV